MQIKFFFKDTSINIPERKRLKQFLLSLFGAESKAISSLNYIFCTDEYLLLINKEFLKHHDYTDIITFTLSAVGEPIVGEIYISVDRVRENARRFNVTIKKELYRVVFHGALHLCGYTDKSLVDKTNMTRAEDKYLKLFIP